MKNFIIPFAIGAVTMLLAAAIIVPSLREFTTEAQLRHWLADDKTNQVTLPPDHCLEYAKLLQRAALKDRYLISIQTITPADYPRFYGKEMPGDWLHAANMAYIGGIAYLIEPQTDEVWQFN